MIWHSNLREGTSDIPSRPCTIILDKMAAENDLAAVVLAIHQRHCIPASESGLPGMARIATFDSTFALLSKVVAGTNPLLSTVAIFSCLSQLWQEDRGAVHDQNARTVNVLTLGNHGLTLIRPFWPIAWTELANAGVHWFVQMFTFTDPDQRR